MFSRSAPSHLLPSPSSSSSSSSSTTTSSPSTSMDNDFFIHQQDLNTEKVNKNHSVSSFAQAVAGRFGTPQLTASPLSLENMSIASPPPSTSSSSFSPVSPAALPALLALPSLLILDIRSPSAFATTRIPNALPLSVPSTLLKRPAFSLQKLAQMLSSPAARKKFAKWKDAHKVLVYDADTLVLGDKESPALLGLCRKFVNEGFAGEICWLRGGLQAVWREARDVLVSDAAGADSDDMDDTNNNSALRAQTLPNSAFQHPSFGPGLASKSLPHLHPRLNNPPLQPPLVVPRISPTKQFPRPALQAAASMALQQQQQQSLNISYAFPHSHTSSIPFYDNIRQNYELGLGGNMAGISSSENLKGKEGVEVIPLVLPEEVLRRAWNLLGRLEAFSDEKDGDEDGERVSENPNSFNSSPNDSLEGTSASEVSDEDGSSSSPVDSPRDELDLSTRSASMSVSASGSPREEINLDDENNENDAESQVRPRPDPLQTSKPAMSTSSQVTQMQVQTVSSRSRTISHPPSPPSSSNSSTRPQSSSSHRSSRSPPSQSAPSHTHSSKTHGVQIHAQPSPLAWLRRLIASANTARGAEALAHQFLEIEREEQRRMVGVMRWHSKEGSVGMEEKEVEDEEKEKDGGEDVAFPYSITAGVEKGTKNRYRNIWPFEHARVRLRKPFLMDIRPTVVADTEGTSSAPEKEEKDKDKRELSANVNAAAALAAAVAAQTSSATNHSPVPASSSGDGASQTAPQASFVPSLPVVPAYITPLTTHYPRGPLSSHTLSQIPFPPFVSHAPPTPFSAFANGTPSPLTSPTPTTPGSSYAASASDAGEDEDDYVNASYVQPLGTNKRYIATQGPLESTFVDFWTLVWQQNVRVIIMLTREVEGAQMKCGRYWQSGRYGPLRLELLDVEGEEEGDDKFKEGERDKAGTRESRTGFDFYVPTSVGIAEERLGMALDAGEKGKKAEENLIVKRRLRLTHTRVGRVQTQSLSSDGRERCWPGKREAEGYTEEHGSGNVPSFFPRGQTQSHRSSSLSSQQSSTGSSFDAKPDFVAGAKLDPPHAIVGFTQHRGQEKEHNTTSESESEQQMKKRGGPVGVARSSTVRSSQVKELVSVSDSGGSGKSARSGEKKENSRVITQLQYLGWPDMNVPDDPKGLLKLIKEANKAVARAERDCEEESDSSNVDGDDESELSEADRSSDREKSSEKRREKRKTGPVLLHCSAGVGRTGGFIIVDAMLDGVRREVRNKERERMEKEKSREKKQKDKYEKERKHMISVFRGSTTGDTENGNETADVDSSIHSMCASADVSASGSTGCSRSGSAEAEDKMDVDLDVCENDMDRIAIGSSNNESDLLSEKQMYASLRIGHGPRHGVKPHQHEHHLRGGKGGLYDAPLIESVRSSWAGSDPGLSHSSTTTRSSNNSRNDSVDLRQSLLLHTRRSRDSDSGSASGGRAIGSASKSSSSNSTSASGHVVHIPMMKTGKLSTMPNVMRDLTDVERGILDRRMDLEKERHLSQGMFLDAGQQDTAGVEVHANGSAQNSSSGSASTVTPARSLDASGASPLPGTGTTLSRKERSDKTPSYISLQKLNENPLTRLTPYFTADDAAQMFTNDKNECPEFAMDIEPVESDSYINRNDIVAYTAGVGCSDKGRAFSFKMRSGFGSGNNSGGLSRFSSDEASEPWRMSSEDSDSNAAPFGRSYLTPSSMSNNSSTSSVPLKRFASMTTSSPTPLAQRTRNDSAGTKLHGLPLSMSAATLQGDASIKDGSAKTCTSSLPGEAEPLQQQSVQSPMQLTVDKYAALRSSSPLISSGLSTDRNHASSSSSGLVRASDVTLFSNNVSSPTGPTSISALPVREDPLSRPTSPPREKRPKQVAKKRDRTRSTQTDPEFDYSAPRELHRDVSPLDLSSLKDPIQEVLEDMREQRMSLCQSLRQYVFVHRAIIEGALQIVEEERNIVHDEDNVPAKDVDVEIVSPVPEYRTVNGQAEIFDMDDLFMIPAQAGGKRGASPTELPMTDKKGEAKLSKRPSIKRGKSASSTESASKESSLTVSLYD